MQWDGIHYQLASLEAEPALQGSESQVVKYSLAGYIRYLPTEDQPNKLSPENRVVIYGDRIEAYSCMSALLELGLGPELLIFVEPYPSTEGDMRVNCFNDDTVSLALNLVTHFSRSADVSDEATTIASSFFEWKK